MSTLQPSMAGADGPSEMEEVVKVEVDEKAITSTMICIQNGQNHR